MTTCTWNIAAVNNNPLEYWTTYDSPGYMQLMVDVERMIDSPGERDDVPLGTIFPAFEDLATRMAAVELASGSARGAASMTWVIHGTASHFHA